MTRYVLLKVDSAQDISDGDMLNGMICAAFDVSKSPLRVQVMDKTSMRPDVLHVTIVE